jgi:hypothetical protein
LPLEKEGNPIHDGRSKRMSRAFRIIQWAPKAYEPELAAWVKSYEEEFVELPRHELVINLSLSEESARLSEELLRKWMMPETTPAEMEQFIRDHENPPSV